MDTVTETLPHSTTYTPARPNWLALFVPLFSVFTGLPFLAPIFMKMGLDGPGRAIYLVYSFLCHQMAQRSFFLFGPRGFQMYNLADLPVADKAPGSNTVLVMRQFIGNSDIGWKVAWSDRMVYMYGAILLMAIVYAFARKQNKVKPLPIWAFALLLLPMAVDGGTHMISDLAGVGQGFRYTNAWLAALTGHTLPGWFYAGDAFGSFNSWMRLLSGVTFGIAIVGLMFPWIDLTMPPRDTQATNATP
jgi:uncharacterized membrane protein